MKSIIIQEEIKITQKEIDEAIKYYGELPDTFRLGIFGKILDKKKIIEEIKKFSKIGKKILLIRYEYKRCEGKYGLKGDMLMIK